MKEVTYRVSGVSNVKKMAGIVAHTLKGDGGTEASNVVLSCCGASALSQAVKAVAVARSFLVLNGKDIITRPMFDTTMMPNESGVNEERTVVKLLVSLG